MVRILFVLALVSPFSVVLGNCALAAEDAEKVEFAKGSDRLCIVIDGLPVAVYYVHDNGIPRPFFAHVRAPNGAQVTRHHPPIEGQDLTDHATFHPGIWMSFGDISGSDYWRTSARVRHVGYESEPQGGESRGTFSVRNEYMDQNDPSEIVCQELARFTILVRPAGYLLLWDSTFTSDREFVFGDQEEMGLGVRVATPLRVEKESDAGLPPGNGTIIDSEGRKNGDEVWGNTAKWCDYSGTLADERVGMTIFCHPKNFRPSWFHARDYGLLEANPFGRQAFGKGEKSSVAIKPGEEMRLRYGVLLHAGPKDSKVDFDEAYEDYVAHAE